MPKIHFLFFFIILVVLGVLFEYHKTTDYKPQSSHIWRQADGAAFAANYARYDNGLFSPRLYNRQEADGYMVGEFPILYYISGQFYKILGVQEWIPRGLNLLLFFLGLFALFWLTFQITGHLFWSYAIPILFFAAPVLTYYGNNFLPDVPSFSFLMMGWAVFMSYYKKSTLLHLYGALLLFAIAGLLKITMLISVVALGAMFFMEWAGWIKFKNQEKLFKHLWHTLGAFGGMVILIGAWYWFSNHYNTTHGSDYFLSGIFSPWTWENMEWFTYTIYRTFFFWSKWYFLPVMHLLFIILTIYILLGRRSPGSFLYYLTLLTFIGFNVFFHLWFYQFKDHDYYIIPGYTFLVFLLLSTLISIKKHNPDFYNNLFLKIAVVTLLVANVWYAKHTIYQRYEGMLQYKPNQSLYHHNLDKYLTNLNISPNDLVISIPDQSPNISLYLLDRPGFTEWIDRRGTKITEAHVKDFINRGAQYLIITDDSYLEKPYVKPFTTYKIGDFNGIKIYDLEKY